MTEFLVELYRSRHDVQAAATDGDRARRAAEALSRDGTAVRLVRAFFVPEDETCFLLYEAPSVDAVRAVMSRAGLPCDEVHEAATFDELLTDTEPLHLDPASGGH